jgi:hypothetical protein
MSAELPKQPIQMSIPVGPKWFVLGYIIGAPAMVTEREIVVLWVKDGRLRPILKRAVACSFRALRMPSRLAGS